MNRKIAREILMQKLYEMEFNKNFELPKDETMELLNESNQKDYFIEVFDLFKSNLSVIDSKIENNLINWKINRISKVDLAILRLAITEILFVDDIDNIVSIDEAIELAKKFSDEKSATFINGILDKIIKE